MPGNHYRPCPTARTCSTLRRGRTTRCGRLEWPRSMDPNATSILWLYLVLVQDSDARLRGHLQDWATVLRYCREARIVWTHGQKRCVCTDRLDQMARASYDSPPSEPLSLAFACDMHKLESIDAAVRDIQAAWPSCHIGTAVYNGSVRKRGPFLESKMDQLRESVDGSMYVSADSYAFYTFAQQVLRAMESHGQGGSLLVTGASASIRGRMHFPLFGAASVYCADINRRCAAQHVPGNCARVRAKECTCGAHRC